MRIPTRIVHGLALFDLQHRTQRVRHERELLLFGHLLQFVGLLGCVSRSVPIVYRLGLIQPHFSVDEADVHFKDANKVVLACR